MRIGASMASHKPHLILRNSRHKMPQLGDVFNHVMNKAKGESTLVCPVVGARPNLINMKCRYFFSLGGCTRPDCRFLHHEPVQDVVFHDGTEKSRFRDATYISPGPRAEVKVFIGNLPSDTQSAFVVDLASPFGEVNSVIVLPSKLKHTRRCAAIMYMSSDAQADAAIDAINAYIDEYGQYLYARKEYSRPLDVTPPPQLKRLLQATKVATIQTKAKPKAKAPMPSTLAPPVPAPVSSPKKKVKPVLTCDDGFCLPSKAVRLTSDAAVKMFNISASVFAPLYDLDDDLDIEEVLDDDDKEQEQEDDEVDDESEPEIASLTQGNAELADPKLGLQPSPTSIIWGAWSDAERRLRVMTPFKMPQPKKAKSSLPWAGWFVSNKRWSDA